PDFVVRAPLHPHVVLLAGRWITALAGAACAPAIAAIGGRLGAPTAGLIAGLALAVDRTAVQRSHLCGNEMPMVLVGLLAVLVALRARDAGASTAEPAAADPRRARRAGAGSGLLAGIATAVKYSGGSFLAPIAVALGR